MAVTTLPGQALAATVTLGDDLISAAECSDRASKSISLSWDFGGATSGTEYAIVASTDSGCPASSSDSGITTQVVVDGITASSTSQSNSDLTLADLLSAAGVTSPSCTGDDTQIYVCVRLLDSSGSTLSTASARLKLQVASPPPPSDVSVAPGESALTVSWSPGTATTAAPASSKTYRVFAAAGGRTVQSDETSNTSLRLSGLEIGTTYDVTVVAYSQAGNASAASDLVPGTPVNVTDFWESYQAAGGRDGGGGGCAHAGMDPLALSLLVVALLLWRRPRRPGQHLVEPTRATRAALLLFVPALLVDRARADSPHLGSLELRLSGYRPRIDSEFAGAASPYADAFGSGRGWMGRVHLSGEVARLAGALEVGAGAGYFERYGHGRIEDGSRSADTTALKIVPLSLTVTYRWEDAFDRFGVPLVPYARLSLERYQWWALNGGGATSQAVGRQGYGATHGYSATLGLAFPLDALDAASARQMDRNWGLNHLFVFADVTRSSVNDFGSRRSWDLSDDGFTWAGGLLLAF